MDIHIINCNFCREHQTLKSTPAQAVGLEVTGWKDLIEKSQTQTVMKDNKSALQIEVMDKQ